MPDKNTAQTGWVIAATEGATVDGRVISGQWIKEMAESYSPEEYGALIWPEHFRSSWAPYEGKNWGTVDDVKASKKGGKLRLFVKLTANSYLLEANKDQQKLYMSIEPDTDYLGSGKCYLRGLAVTDSPASSGTTRLKFSMGEREIEHEFSQLEELQHTDFLFSQAPQNKSKEEQAKGLFTQLLNLFTNEQATGEPDNAEDEPMKEEQFNKLIGKIDGVTSKVDDLEKKFGTLETQVDKFNTSGANIVVTEPAADEQAPAEDTNITAEQFSQLSSTITDLSEKFTGMETKFAKLSQEDVGQEPDPAGHGESIALV
jgi:hypothetical protein